MVRVSKSKLLLYKQCPLKYKFLYIDGLWGEPTEAMQDGINIHGIFEKFHKDFNPVFLNDEVLKKRMSLYSNEKYLHHEENFLNFNKMILKKSGIKHFSPCGIEKKFLSKNKEIVGIIDAVYKIDDTVMILDYKSGKHRKGNEGDYRFELAIYAFLWDSNNEIKSTHWGIFFSKDGYLWKEKINKNIVKKVLLEIEVLKNNILKNNFTPKKNCFCNWCDFKKRCPLW